MTQGILQNGEEQAKPNGVGADFDRSVVLENTELNAKLGSAGEEVRRKIAARRSSVPSDSIESSKETSAEPEDLPHENGNGPGRRTSFTDTTSEPHHKRYPKTRAPPALQEALRSDVQWDEKGISEHDLERGQTEKIDEPNTPFLGTARDTEYYDEDPVPEDLDLGEAL